MINRQMGHVLNAVTLHISHAIYVFCSIYQPVSDVGKYAENDGITRPFRMRQSNSDQTLAWALRIITMMAVTAAGVTPETRETCPIECGRVEPSRSFNSRDNPGTDS